jgi:hypothetical protein
MHPKFVRFFVRDFYCRKILIALLLMSIALVAEAAVLKDQGRRLAQYRRQNEAIAKIPKWEKALRQNLSPEQIARPTMNFQGTGIRDNNFYAIIDGNVYTVGDAVGDWRVAKIASGCVVLKNPSTNETRQFTIPQPEMK